MYIFRLIVVQTSWEEKLPRKRSLNFLKIKSSKPTNVNEDREINHHLHENIQVQVTSNGT